MMPDSASERELQQLAESIDETRLTYEETDIGVTVTGSPFVIEFGVEIDPDRFYDEAITAEKPWKSFGVKNQLDGEYYRISGVRFHIEDGDVVGTSQFDAEVCPEWVRIYVRGDADEVEIAEFVREIADEFDGTVRFTDE